MRFGNRRDPLPLRVITGATTLNAGSTRARICLKVTIRFDTVFDWFSNTRADGTNFLKCLQ
jgi:hypothetical protein